MCTLKCSVVQKPYLETIAISNLDKTIKNKKQELRTFEGANCLIYTIIDIQSNESIESQKNFLIIPIKIISLDAIIYILMFVCI